MKTLFLVRHGKSSWADPNLADAQRPLKKRGHRQATALGPALRARGALGGRIVSSPAVRARETTRVMLDSATGQEATSPEIQDALYTFSAEALLDWLQSQPPRSPLTIVGHNPALLGLANRLLNGRLEHLPTGAVVEITLPGQSWRQVGRQTAEKTALLLPEHLSYKLFKRKAPSPPPELSHSSLSRRIPASLAHQAQLILALEPGVRMGVDPEFLHQFRVNLRRSRAIAEALQRVEKNSTLKKATKGLKRQAQETSQLRDLDVFLETLSAWNEDPERAGLIQTIGLESIFRDRQQQEHERLCRVLDSDAYNHDIQRWQSLIEEGTVSELTRQIKRKRIHKAIDRQIARHNDLLEGLDADSPDSDFHTLRKALKRVRYMLELDPGHLAIKDLKARQKLLGSFQDRHVQLAFLCELDTPALGAAPRSALKTLVNHVSEEKRQARDRILSLTPLQR